MCSQYQEKNNGRYFINGKHAFQLAILTADTIADGHHPGTAFHR